jgi:hypothetical protein
MAICSIGQIQFFTKLLGTEATSICLTDLILGLLIGFPCRTHQRRQSLFD